MHLKAANDNTPKGPGRVIALALAISLASLASVAVLAY
jgi:hypothetical protein